MAEQVTLARPYAQAVFELARDTKALDRWSEMLAVLVEAVSIEEVWQVVNSPRLGRGEIAELLAEIGGERFDEPCRNLVRVLAANRRLDIIPELAALYEKLRAEHEGRIDAAVISARALSDAQQQKIAAALKKRLGREVNLTCTVDETLIGGAVVRAGDLLIDGSARGKLQRLAAGLGS